MTTTLERNIEDAVQSADDLRHLGAYLKGMVDAGIERGLLQEALTQVYKRFRASGNEAAADLTLDGLDLLTGWCGPAMKIPEPQSA